MEQTRLFVAPGKVWIRFEDGIESQEFFTKKEALAAIWDYMQEEQMDYDTFVHISDQVVALSQTALPVGMSKLTDPHFSICDCGHSPLHGYVSTNATYVLGPFHYKEQVRHFIDTVVKLELLSKHQAARLVFEVEESMLPSLSQLN